jgi:hypothetical protein
MPTFPLFSPLPRSGPCAKGGMEFEKGPIKTKFLVTVCLEKNTRKRAKENMTSNNGNTVVL